MNFIGEHSKRKYFITSLLIILYIIISSFFLETTDLFKGVGSDGFYISNFTPDLLNHLKNKTIVSEGLNRLFPMMIAHIFYKVFYFDDDKIFVVEIEGFEASISSNIVEIFKYLNIIYLSISVIIFAYIFQKLKISLKYFILFISLLFANFMFLKQFFYEPVFLDQFYFFYSSLIVLAVFQKNKYLQFLLIFLSPFVNVLYIVITPFLFIFNDKIGVKISINKWIPGGAILLFFGFIALYLVNNPLCTEEFENKTILSLLPVSIICVVIYYFYFFIKAIPLKTFLFLTKNYKYYISLVFGLAGFIIIRKTCSTFINVEICEGLSFNPINMFINIFRQAISRPFGFISSHFNYFGLFVILLLFHVRTFYKILENENKYFPFYILFIFTSVTSESRYLTSFLPILVFLFIIQISKEGNSSSLSNPLIILLILVINIVWSGFYISINPLGSSNYISDNALHYNNLYIEPLQKYFKHLGPWTSDESYVWQLSIFCFFLLFFILIEYCFKYRDNK